MINRILLYLDVLILYISSPIEIATTSAIFSMIGLPPLSSLARISLILFWLKIRYQKRPVLIPQLNCNYRQHATCNFYSKKA